MTRLSKFVWIVAAVLALGLTHGADWKTATVTEANGDSYVVAYVAPEARPAPIQIIYTDAYKIEVGTPECAEKDARDCFEAIEAACDVHGLTVSAVEFDLHQRHCSGECSDGRAVDVVSNCGDDAVDDPDPVGHSFIDERITEDPEPYDDGEAEGDGSCYDELATCEDILRHKKDQLELARRDRDRAFNNIRLQAEELAECRGEDDTVDPVPGHVYRGPVWPPHVRVP